MRNSLLGKFIFLAIVTISVAAFAEEVKHAVLISVDFASLGLPSPTENHEAPHLILATGQGYSFNGDLTGDVIGPATATYKGTHGHLPQPAYMHATFVAAGQGIRAGVQLKTINNTDVAPTLARLMELKLDGADGRVLREILKD